MADVAHTTDARGFRGVRTTLGTRLVLLVGYLGLAVAALIAHGSPADGYEQSIYGATPALVWVGAGAAAVAALIAGYRARRPLERGLAVGLVGATFVLVVGLPIIRAYEFFGTGDPLSHVGWVRDVAGGVIGLNDLMYPGLHTMTLAVAGVGAATFWTGMLFSVVAYALAFVVFVPLATSLFTDESRPVITAAVAACMLLPINNVSAHLSGHPSTLAILFVPAVLYVLVRYLTKPVGDRFSPSGLGVVLGLFTLSLMLVHPQQAFNVLLLFVAVLGIQLYRRRRYAEATWLHPVNAQTVFLGGVFVIWTWGHERAIETADSYASLLLSPRSPASELAQRGSSLTEIGASLWGLYLKLFLVSTVFAILAAGLFLFVTARGDFKRRSRPLVVAAVGIGTVPAFVGFLLYLATNIGTMYFRQLGFVMVVATVFGTVAFHRLLARFGDRFSIGSGGRAAVATTVIAVMVVLSALVVFPSPYIYKPNSHISEGVVSGYQSSFETADPDVEFLGIRQGPARYHDAVTGTGDLVPAGVRRSNGVTSEEISAGLAASYEESHYLGVTDLDRSRELTAFRGLRYSERDFASVRSQPDVHRVRATGDFELYLID